MSIPARILSCSVMRSLGVLLVGLVRSIDQKTIRQAVVYQIYLTQTTRRVKIQN